MMETIEIDDLTRDFYKAVSFSNDKAPEQDKVTILFHGDGIIINNSFRNPLGFSAASFVSSLESEIAAGTMSRYLVHELHAKTELFGKLAHRVSVYEYNLGEDTSGRLSRGVNYIQFIEADGNWRILSMAWCDEDEEHIIPNEYLR
jgi:hypothetical protein